MVSALGLPSEFNNWGVRGQGTGGKARHKRGTLPPEEKHLHALHGVYLSPSPCPRHANGPRSPFFAPLVCWGQATCWAREGKVFGVYTKPWYTSCAPRNRSKFWEPEHRERLCKRSTGTKHFGPKHPARGVRVIRSTS